MGKKATLLLGKILFSITTYLVAILTIVGWLAGVVNPEASWFISLIALGMTPLLCLNLLFLIIWAIKRSWIFAIPLMAILMNYGYIVSMFKFDFRSQEQLPAVELRVATYNIHGYSHRNFAHTLDNVLSEFNAMQVDVASLQEFSPLTNQEIDSVSVHYPHHVILSPHKHMQLALFSKYPIIAAEFINFEQTVNGAMWADIKVNDRIVKIINVHFQTTNLNQSKGEISTVKDLGIEDPNGKKAFDVIMDRLSHNASLRSKQVEIICNKIQSSIGNPLIVCGDFNDIPSSYTYRQIVNNDLTDSFISAGSGYGYTFVPLYKLFRLDYILYQSKDLVGVNCFSPEFAWSDHNPVVVGLSFTSK